jgi:hypothetical protein
VHAKLVIAVLFLAAMDPSQFTFEPLEVKTILVNLLIGTGLGLMLKFHFERFGSSLSGRGELAKILPFLVLIVCLIISVVKSSLALSLGLVGALSIVRFRTPIKEAEDLVYLFMAIAMGLGLGANQVVLSVSASFFILVVVALLRWNSISSDPKGIFLSVNWDSETEIDPKLLGALVAESSLECDLKRYDVSDQNRHMAFSVLFSNIDQVYQTMSSIEKAYPSAQASFIDQSRVPGV